jgi:hypothetical protein
MRRANHPAPAFDSEPRGTSNQASRATTETAQNRMVWLMAKARPRKCAGTSSARYDRWSPVPRPRRSRKEIGMNGVPEKRIGEDGAASKTVCHKAHHRGAKEQPGKYRGDEARDSGGPDQAGRTRPGAM